MNQKFVRDFVSFNFNNCKEEQAGDNKNLRPTNLPCAVRNTVRGYYRKFPNLNASQIKEKLNLPDTVGNLPLEHKWVFAYFKKYGSKFDENNNITSEELLTPLTEHEKDDLYHLI